MATGTGNLPQPNNTVSPFDIGTSEWANSVKANIDSLASGTGVGDGAVTYNKLLSTIFSGEVSSLSNAGTAGGTIKYLNIGGLKLLWATGASKSSNATGTGVQFTFTLPAGFFTTINSIYASPSSLGASVTQLTSVVSSSTSTVTVACIATSGSGTSQVPNILIIGI